MATLQDLRKRRQSILSSQKMTSAMKMVATAKFRQFQKEWGKASTHLSFLEAALGRVASTLAFFDLPFFAQKKPRTSERRILWIVVGADRGLCGGFNTQIARFFRTQYEAADSGPETKAIVIGNRPALLLEKMGIDLLYKNAMGMRLSFTQAQNVANMAFDLFEKGAIDECRLVYTRFLSIIRQEVITFPFLPFSLDPLMKKNLPLAPHLMEPSPVLLCDSLGRLAAQVFLHKVFLESSLSEQGARMTAMESASRNSGDMLQQLNLLYNRKRQSLITNELIEVISGANV